MRILLGAVFLFHALIHTGYLSPAPARAGGPEWPFEMSRSWLVTQAGVSTDVVRAVGTALVALVIVAMLGAALATVGIVIPQAWWRAMVVAGASASLLTLVVFFHPWIVLGLLIDGVILYLVLVAGWDPVAGVGAPVRG